jgi:hypothetical protein
MSAGVPFIIDDVGEHGAETWKMADWTCDWATKNFGKTKMKREYSADGSGEKNVFNMGDKNWHSSKETNGVDPVQMQKEGGPKFAPMYWDVKAMLSEPERGWGTNTTKIREAVLENTVVPYWMDPANLHDLKVRTSPTRSSYHTACLIFAHRSEMRRCVRRAPLCALLCCRIRRNSGSRRRGRGPWHTWTSTARRPSLCRCRAPTPLGPLLPSLCVRSLQRSTPVQKH